MRKIRLLIPAGAIAFFAFTAAMAGATESLSYPESRALATQQNKLLLVDFFADWCGPCKHFAHDAGTDSALKEALAGVVLCSIDAEKGEGVGLAKAQGVVGYPTFVLLNAGEKTVHRWTGYGDAADFMTTLAAGVEDPTPADERAARFESAPTARDAAMLGRMADDTGDYTSAERYYLKAAELNTDPSVHFDTPLLEVRFAGYGEDKFTLDQVRSAADLVLARRDVSADDLLETGIIMLNVARQARDMTVAVPYLKAAIGSAGDGTGDPMKREICIAHALYVAGDAARAVSLKRESMPAGWMNQPDGLNSFAWWCFENKVNLDEAKTLAMKGVDLAEPGKAKAMILDTAAEICNAMRNCHEAVELATQAARENPDSDYYRKQVDRFQKELADESQGKDQAPGQD